MFFIPGFVISLATFPGVIVHEAAHLFFCKLFGLAVYDVCFFRVGNPAGYVIHEKTDDFRALFFVSMGPFVINTLLCMVFCTTVDLTNIWAVAPDLAKKGNILAIVSLPLAAVLHVLNYARVVWADLGYGIAVGILGPIAIFKALA
jgi:hypothetical protein